MKILIIHLGSTAEKLLLRPSLNTLKRSMPNAVIHLLTQEIDAQLKQHLSAVDNFYTFEPNSFFSLDESSDLDEEMLKCQRWISSLKKNKYETVFNLSLTSTASHLSELLSYSNTQVCGLRRTSDNFLAIDDDASAYIWGQCRFPATNRVHLSDLYAAVLGVELNPCDLDVVSCETELQKKKRLRIEHLHGKDFILLNPSSYGPYTVDINKWSHFLKYLVEQANCEIKVMLSGLTEEDRLRLQTLVRHKQISYLACDYCINEQVELIRLAKLVVNSGSELNCLAQFSKTAFLSVFPDARSAWMAGPKSVGSRLVIETHFEHLRPDLLALEALHTMDKKKSVYSILEATEEAKENIPSFIDLSQQRDFSWRVCQSIYLDVDWPELDSEELWQGMQNIYESNEIVISQLKKMKGDAVQAEALDIIDRVDEIFDGIAILVPDLVPLIQWYKTEKLRIGPGPVQQLVEETERVHVMMRNATSRYFIDSHVEADRQGG